ncbi:MAG: hypothetical protein ACPGVG_10805 [Mycobacterium sp.]
MSAAAQSRPRWQTGIAEVTSATGPKVTVLCPHCRQSHTHPRNFVGSRYVIAGCHKGWTRLRAYAVVEKSGAPQ